MAEVIELYEGLDPGPEAECLASILSSAKGCASIDCILRWVRATVRVTTEPLRRCRVGRGASADCVAWGVRRVRAVVVRAW